MTQQTQSVVLSEMLTPHIALVTLNRPNKRNAVDGEVAAALEASVMQFEDDPEVRAENGGAKLGHGSGGAVLLRAA